MNIEALFSAPVIILPLNALHPDQRLEIHLGVAKVDTTLADRFKFDEIYDRYDITFSGFKIVLKDYFEDEMQ